MFSQLGNVQQKISCIFDTVVLEEPSTKRAQQSYRVVAGDTLRVAASDAEIEKARPSEKLDGTCALVDIWMGKPWLYARHDKKPNKAADKRFKRFQLVKRQKAAASDQNSCDGHRPSGDSSTNDQDVGFLWDVEKDFKEVPDEWRPASGVPMKDGIPQPDSAGHIPGWVPVNSSDRLHCWHLTAVDLEQGIALVLQENEDIKKPGLQELKIKSVPLDSLLGRTVELIGTFINANPYGLGTKQSPVHLIIRHGSISFRIPPSLDYSSLKNWMAEEPDGQVEGIVWHCSKGQMFKLHRHHVQLKWPVPNLRLLTLPVSVSIEGFQPSHGSLFDHLRQFNGKTFQGLNCVQYKNDHK